MERSIIKNRTTLSRITFQYIYSFSTSVELIDVQKFILSSFCPVVKAFRTDSSYFLHSRIVFDVKQSWERVPLPCLDGVYSKISWFFFILGVFCSRKQRFLSLFVCYGAGKYVSCYFLFRLELETMFLTSVYLLESWRCCFLLLLVCEERRNRVSWFSLNDLGGETRFLE